MEPIKINVNVELNLSEDVKAFIVSIVSNATAIAPVAKPAPAVNKPTATAPASEAKPTATAPASAVSTSVAPISIDQVRRALATKVADHREEIKDKLNSLGAPSVTKLEPSKYAEMLEFIENL